MKSETEQWSRPFRRCEDVVSRRIAGETILVPIRGKLADMERLFALNPVAEYIWGQLDGQRGLAQIREGVLAEFDVAEEEADADIMAFIGELLQAGLIEAVE